MKNDEDYSITAGCKYAGIPIIPPRRVVYYRQFLVFYLINFGIGVILIIAGIYFIVNGLLIAPAEKKAFDKSAENTFAEATNISLTNGTKSNSKIVVDLTFFDEHEGLMKEISINHKFSYNEEAYDLLQGYDKKRIKIKYNKTNPEELIIVGLEDESPEPWWYGIFAIIIGLYPLLVEGYIRGIKAQKNYAKVLENGFLFPVEITDISEHSFFKNPMRYVAFKISRGRHHLKRLSDAVKEFEENNPDYFTENYSSYTKMFGKYEKEFKESYKHEGLEIPEDLHSRYRFLFDIYFEHKFHMITHKSKLGGISKGSYIVALLWIDEIGYPHSICPTLLRTKLREIKIYE